MWMVLLSLVGGLVLLTVGGEWLVSGAARLAARFGVPALVIGLTVVAFGTSAPELMVTLSAAWEGGDAANLALGNVVGSNIFNVLLILGVCAMLAPLVVNLSMVRVEIPLMIVASAVALWFGRDGVYSRLEGAILFAALLLYIWFTLTQARKASVSQDAPADEHGPLWRQLLSILGGLVLLVLGARWLVSGAVAVAELLGLSETIIGLTIVAAGTSLPEVAASVMATLRNERDIAVGNIVGSNLFNILAVLGGASLIAPHGIAAPASIIAFDGPVMLAVAVACLPIFFTGYRIDRWEGTVFFGYYIAYVAYLVLDASGHAALPLYSQAMLYFVVPLTVLTLLVSLWRVMHRRAGPA